MSARTRGAFAIAAPRQAVQPVASINDLVSLILMLVVGMLTDRLLLFVLPGLVLATLYGRFRDSRPDGFALHWCDWHGLLPLPTRTCPNPFARTWRG